MSTNPFPSAADLADDTLATKPHSTLHGEMGEYLNQTLGYFTASGYNSVPTLFDSDNASWDAGGWWQFNGTSTRATARVGFESGHEVGTLSASHSGTSRVTDLTLYAENDGATASVAAESYAAISDDGTGRAGSYGLDSDLPGFFHATLSDTTVQVAVKANAGQTDPLFDLQDDASHDLVTFTPHDNAGTIDGITAIFVSTDGNFGVQLDATGSVSDGNGLEILTLFSDTADIVLACSYVSGAQISVDATSGQTLSMLDLKDSNGKHIFEVAPDGSVGGVSPSNGWSIKWNSTSGQWEASA